MGSHHPIRKTVAPDIPDKLYFRIGDVAKLCAVPAYVLRFWETEFPQLKPNKGGTGQRLYRRRDVETALRIKSLLYDEGYTIPGARTVLKADTKVKATETRAIAEAPREAVFALTPTATLSEMHAERERAARLQALRQDLRGLAEMLAEPVKAAGGAAGSNLRAKVQTMRPRSSTEKNAPAQMSLERDLF